MSYISTIIFPTYEDYNYGRNILTVASFGDDRVATLYRPVSSVGKIMKIPPRKIWVGDGSGSANSEHTLWVEETNIASREGQFSFHITRSDDLIAQSTALVADLWQRVDDIDLDEYEGPGSTRRNFFKAALGQIITSTDPIVYQKLLDELVGRAVVSLGGYFAAGIYEIQRATNTRPIKKLDRPKPNKAALH